jgi:opacity protein-like surface antigen
MKNLDIRKLVRGSGARLLPRPYTLLLLLVAALSLLANQNALAQSLESATAGRSFIWVGGAVSGYYIQYGQAKNLGVTGYVDADSIRRFGIEAEGRWLDFHEKNNVHAETYLAGPRYHFNLGRYQPYAKGMVGIGKFNFPFNYAQGTYFVIAPGGGLDYRLSPRWSARADFEYQYWPQFTFGPMSSGGISVGVRYLILR